tara:strand:+ start:310 stop:558 length:249 start_codon:yes stop_codon:yes gene_type:complete
MQIKVNKSDLETLKERLEHGDIQNIVIHSKKSRQTILNFFNGKVTNLKTFQLLLATTHAVIEARKENHERTQQLIQNVLKSI